MSSTDIVTGPERRAALPHWDLSAAFPGLESPAFAAGFRSLTRQVDDLERLFAAEGIAGGAEVAQPAVDAFERTVNALNDVLQAFATMRSFLYGHVATDSRNDLAQARLSELDIAHVRLQQLHTRFVAWLGALDVDDLIARSAVAAAHAFPLRKIKLGATHLLSPAEEDLAAALEPTGGGGWAKLHANLTSQLEVPLTLDGQPRTLPMSEVRNLAAAPDRTTRRRAYEAELGTWEAAALPLAAALNGIKGEVNTLNAKRGWPEPLDRALFQNNIDRATLDALLTAARESLPDFRRYLHLKARAIGVPALAWYDLLAPVGEPGRAWTWSEATAFVAAQFGAYSERMRALAQRAYDARWIDAEPRPGKVDGGFCMGLIPGESRILVNFSDTYDGVQTLAHELGHAYHNLNTADLTPLQRATPMVLAETASIFCETIVREAALAKASPGEQLFIIEQSLQGSCQVVVDIISRFDFEQRVFAARHERELSIAELNRFMLDAQRGTYGDGLDGGLLHAYMWAVKGHYYSQDRSYYNFPYLFGLLFGLGLYVRYREQPDEFRARYDDLLASTGLASAADLGERFGIDLRSADFWRSSLDVIRNDIVRFERLI